MEAEPGGYHNGNVNNWQFDTTTLFGPRLSWGRSKRIDPCVHILWGGQYPTTSIAASLVVVVNLHTTTKLQGGRYTASTNAFAMAVGGGLDIKLNRPIVFRPIQLDYLLTRFEVINVTVPPGQGVTSARNQNNLRYEAGVAFLFGGEKPAPATKPCPDGSTVPIDHPCPKLNTNLGLSASESEVCPGAVVQVRPTTTLPAGAVTEWSVNAVSGAGTKQTADFQPYFCGASTDVSERRGQTMNQNDESAKLRRIEVWFVPTNGKPPETSKNPQDAASAGVAKLGCPR
jgi:hypothetical protein